MSRNQNLAAVGILLALAAATVIWLQLRDGARVTPPAPATGSPTATVAKPSDPAAGSATAPKPRVRRMSDPSGRGEMLRQIREVHAKRTTRPTPVSSSETPAPSLPPATIEKEYIRASVRELIPLLVECFEQGLERDPKLGGSIIVDFTIEGEPGVGGVVGESTIDGAASTLTDPAVRECVQETMFAIEIEPPAGGGIVKVRYPFEFRAGPE